MIALVRALSSIPQEAPRSFVADPYGRKRRGRRRPRPRAQGDAPIHRPRRAIEYDATHGGPRPQRTHTGPTLAGRRTPLACARAPAKAIGGAAVAIARPLRAMSRPPAGGISRFLIAREWRGVLLAFCVVSWVVCRSLAEGENTPLRAHGAAYKARRPIAPGNRICGAAAAARTRAAVWRKLEASFSL